MRTRSARSCWSASLGGALGCWVVLYGLSYSAESLSHALFPGLVVAALLGLPLVARRRRRRGCGGRGHCRPRRARRHRPRHRGRRSWSRRCSGSARCSRSPPTRPPGLQELLFGDVLAVSRRDLAGRGADRRAAAGRAAVLHGRLLAVGLRPLRARAPRRPPAPWTSSCCCSSPRPSSSRAGARQPARRRGPRRAGRRARLLARRLGPDDGAGVGRRDRGRHRRASTSPTTPARRPAPRSRSASSARISWRWPPTQRSIAARYL